MPIGVRLEPEHLTAPAGADIEGAIVLDNPSSDAVHVRVVIASEVAGWASVEPGDVWVPGGAEHTVELRFRLPRGAPGGVGAIPFTIRVLSDQDGEGGATAVGSLDVIGEAELALRLLPATFKGTLSGSTRVAIDNLGSAPARAQLLLDASDTVALEADPDSLIVEPNSTAFAKVTVRPSARHVSGSPRAHEFWVRLEPMGGARISASGTMLQRSLVAGLLPLVAGALVVLVLLGVLLTRVVGGGDDGDRLATDSPVTTVTTTPSTTTPPATTAPPANPDPAAATTTIPLKARRIAFQSKRDGNYEIYTSDAEGKDVKNLTMHPGHDGEPAWSPDHTRIAFDSDRNGGFDIYVMNADGSGLAQVTTEPALDGYPAWSPDGTRIAFTSFRDGNSEIYVMNADGTGARKLTKNLADDSRPQWSPDGSKLVFHSDRDGNYEIYVMNADGTDQRNLSNTPTNDKNPVWSPNGARLAFDTTRDGGKPEIYVMGADGSLPVRLTTNDDLDAWPVWSPDGLRLLFQTDQDSDLELHSIAAGGGPEKRLTESPGEDAEPSWA
jgi:Tol biopolymer transport system component